MRRMPVYVQIPAVIGIIVAAVAGATASGCRGSSRMPGVPAGMVPVHILARQLSLHATSNSAHLASLEDGRNYLLIVGPPNASVSLNGTPINHHRILSINGTLYVSRSLAGRISPLLRAPAMALRRQQRTSKPMPWKPPPPSARGIVVLDAGHGGKDTGAPNRYGPVEKYITLDTTQRTERMLRLRGITTVMTRRTDAYPSLEQRSDLSNRVKPRLFVSIHADSAENRKARGFTVYVARKASSRSIAAANQAVKSLKAAGLESRGVKRANFHVLTQTNDPAILIELGYLSNRADARNLSTASYRQKLAQAIVDGVVTALAPK
jgi:N-acetylmuramoyl-L-alanine amidase